MKTDKIIGFRETAQVIAEIDNRAEAKGLDRSNFLRQLVRDGLGKSPVSKKPEQENK